MYSILKVIPSYILYTLMYFVARDNFLNMDVYFAQLKHQMVVQQKAYELTQFLGEYLMVSQQLIKVTCIFGARRF